MNFSRRAFLIGSAASAGLVSIGEWAALAEEEKRAENPFLLDNFAPVREEISADDLKVVGKLPADLNGMFVRNGPNPQFSPKQNYHWFDGDGMLHGVRLEGGKASYRNRWVRTDAWNEEHKAGKALYPSFLDPPDLAELAASFLEGRPPVPNRANTALVWHNGKLLALWEGGEPHEIGLPRLNTVGKYTFGGGLKHPFTAHPKVDPATGEMMFFGYSPIAPFVQYSVADREGKIISTTPLELPRPVMMHDVAITENYTLFLDMPFVFDLAGVALGNPIFKWQPEHGARIGILPRHAKGDMVRWFEIETCFVFHVFNAFEQGDEVTLHGCRFAEYPKFVDVTPGAVTSANFHELADSVRPIVYRWRINLESGKVTEAPHDDATGEFPRVNERLTGRRARFGYTVSGDSRATALVKHDFENGTSDRHELGDGIIAGEGIFVPLADGKAEDDGYLLSLVHNRIDERSEFIVLDTRAIKDAPLARVQLPRRVPYGFHAAWVGDVS